MKPKRSTKPRDNARRGGKKKVSPLVSEQIEYIDWKDVNLLRRFVSDRAKIRARRVSGNDTQQQREIARAIKNAREMALLPYTSRVTTQRGGRGRDGDRRGRRNEESPEFEAIENEDATAESEAAEESQTAEAAE
ncbi:MAG: 30S ribosomal protein S18 [Microthrixaceae bacterium]|nr:30S ribosomal protein S18 [Microthrixaceae bacterium]